MYCVSSALSVAKSVSVHMLCDPVLTFIKAYHLRGSSSNLEFAALSKFDSVAMSKFKKALWDSDCCSLLTAASLSYQQRRESENGPKLLQIWTISLLFERTTWGRRYAVARGSGNPPYT